MEYSKIKIEKNAQLEIFLHGAYEELAIGKRKALVVCPGGGYEFLSDREAEPIALKFFAEGFNVFILRYSVGDMAGDLNPLCEVLSAIKHIRQNSEEYRIFEDRVFVIGFSAGGHLAASSATLYDIPEIEERVGSNRELCKPNGVILCYPVIDGGEFAHKGSIYALCGHKEPTPEQIELFSLQRHVNEKTPPAFLWHTANDGCVPSENSLIFALALRSHKVPCELHMYPNGNHGLALCNKETYSGYQSHLMPYVEGWIDLAINWAEKYPEFK